MRNKFLCLLLFFIPVITLASSSYDDDLTIVRRHLFQWGLEYNFTPKSEALVVDFLKDENLFKNYSQMNDKMLETHLLPMAQAYVRGKSLKGDKQLLNTLIEGIYFWYENRKVSKNWTVRAFLEPRAAASIGALIYEDIVENRLLKDRGEKALAMMANICGNAWYSRTNSDTFQGANIAYRIYGMVGQAVLTNDPSLMCEINRVIAPYFEVVDGYDWNGLPKIGLYSDGSWMQHNGGGAQNYWIGYGTSWISYMHNLAEIVKGTRWQFSQEKLETLAGYYTEALQWYYFKEFSNYHVRGRHSLKREIYTPPQKIASLIDEVLSLSDGVLQTKNELLQIKERLILGGAFSGSRYFWHSGLYITGNENYYISLKTASSRMVGPESGNGNGKKNFHFSSGSMLLLKDGDEYEKARVGWNFNALPGLTAEQNPAPQPLVDWGNNAQSNNAFCAGLTSENIGLSSFQMDRAHAYANITANKSCFFTPEMVVAMGNSIQKKVASNHLVTTTLDQPERKGDVIYSINGKRGTVVKNDYANDEYILKSPSWVLHNDVGYVLLPLKEEELKIALSVEKRVGDWHDLDVVYPKGSIEEVDVFQLSLIHNVEKQQSGYSYFIVPEANEEVLTKIVHNKRVEIAKNDKEAQAIYLSDSETMMISFFERGEVRFSNGWILSSSAPLALLVKKEANSWKFYAADPLFTASEVSLIVNQKLSGGSNVRTIGNGKSEIMTSFLSGKYTGEQVFYSFESE